uniref:Uncharacterized protein n=1 Tax=Anguilla anguilla TaxID=7936 RepID=A0A0E9S2B2_ANGAN
MEKQKRGVRLIRLREKVTSVHMTMEGPT